MRLYTLVQLGEVVLFASVLLFGVLAHRPSVVVFGGGLLIGKAILNILWPEGGTVLRRSLIGYGLGAAFALFGLWLIHQSS
ncbi:MAG: hypothetical protein WAM30_13825 [Candidatus Dormiibacterota bacterium]